MKRQPCDAPILWREGGCLARQISQSWYVQAVVGVARGRCSGLRLCILCVGSCVVAVVVVVLVGGGKAVGGWCVQDSSLAVVGVFL